MFSPLFTQLQNKRRLFISSQTSSPTGIVHAVIQAWQARRTWKLRVDKSDAGGLVDNVGEGHIPDNEGVRIFPEHTEQHLRLTEVPRDHGLSALP